MAQFPIRVLLVDDSPLALLILQRLLATSPDIEVVGTASNGQDALELIPELQPSLVCTDYHMPKMNGLELTRQIMARFPRPILVVSSAVGEGEVDRVFSLLQAGAVDVFLKPRAGAESDVQGAAAFVKKVKIVAGVVVSGRLPTIGSVVTPLPPRPAPGLTSSARAPQIVAIGASTGGPPALQTILSQLPVHFALPVLCVQHISSGFLPGLISWLATHCKLKIQIARPGELPLPGNVYFPRENHHLTLDRRGRLQISSEPPLGGHRPSVTVTFRAVAECYGDAAIGVLLTGMGRDGGEGMQALAEAGALTIAQDEESCVVYGMPRDAVERGAARAVLPLKAIAHALIEATRPAARAPGERN